MNTADIVGLLIAALGGAAVGLERQWSGHADGPGARFAGIRTFTMLGAVGGFSGWLWTAGITAPAAILFAGAVAVVAAAYVAGSRHDIDGTTEVAALVVLAAGVLAGIGSVRLASGIIAVAVLLLVEKSRLHGLVQRIDDVGLRSGVRFAVMALVVLPLLPEGPYGPFGGVRPRELWAMVLFFSGLSFAGYIARRLVGPGHGYLVTGLLGGLVSSTNVTLTFARTSRTDLAMDRPLAFGAVGANAMLYPRVLIATAILNPAVMSHLLLYLTPPALVAALAAAAGARQSQPTGAPDVPQRNPLQLAGALQVAVLFQGVLMAVYLAREFWGAFGVFTSAAVLGLTDVDALTVSMARDVAQTVSPAVAATAIAIGVLTNTGMKLGLALFLGSRRFKMIAGAALVLMLVALGATLALPFPCFS
ncbi:MAG: MgtC/SapB family protein [Vicinamibacterales bacterium]